MSFKPGFWRRCRIALRCLRYVIWAVVALTLVSFAWFNLIGLPGFLKTRLITAARQHGAELEFTRMRLHLIHGLVCDNVRFGWTNNVGKPLLTAREVQLQLQFAALLHGRLQVDGLMVRQGNFTWPLPPTNSLALTNLQTQLHFAANDTWALDQFHADLDGASVSIAGEIIHAPEIRQWKMFTKTKNKNPKTVGAQTWQNQFSRTLERIHFEGRPELNARISGDARDLHTFSIHLNARAPGVETPWFAIQDLQLTAHLTAPADAPTNCDPAWNFWTNLQPFRLEWTARGTDLRSQKLDANAVECNGVWAAPELALTKLTARLGGGQLQATTKLNVATRELSFTNTSSFDLHAVSALLTQKTRERLAEISWTQPPQLHAGGSLVLPAWKRYISDWQDDVEPTVHLRGDVAFSNALMHGVAPLDSVRTHFIYENLIWKLPDLQLARGQTKLNLNGEESEATKNFQYNLGGRFDVEMIRPFLTTSNALRGFKILTFHEPLTFSANVSGNLRNFAALSAAGQLALTNFAVRGQIFESVATDFSYSNLVLSFLHPQMFRAHATQTMTADAVALDFNARMIFFTNGFSTSDPMAICRAIGPKAAHAIEPYEFLSPPTARAQGRLPLRDVKSGHDLDGTDLRFDIIRGAPFRWTKIQTTNITGTIHWLGQQLILTNLAASFYDGTASGHAYFDFQPVDYGCDFNFSATVNDADVRLFAEDFNVSKTNRLAGIFTGHAVVTSGNSKTWRSWNGYGHAQLHNGLLWNIPIFGNFISPVLNALTPGLDVGNSRATDAHAQFTLTNGVVFTDSLDIRSLAMQLQYVGTVDLEQHVSARATAQLLRNTPVIGPVLSLVLSPVSEVFKCEITGTLEQPKVTLLYIPFPKLLTAPLHPIRSVEEIFAPPATNASAKAP